MEVDKTWMAFIIYWIFLRYTIFCDRCVTIILGWNYQPTEDGHGSYTHTHSSRYQWIQFCAAALYIHLMLVRLVILMLILASMWPNRKKTKLAIRTVLSCQTYFALLEMQIVFTTHICSSTGEAANAWQSPTNPVSLVVFLVKTLIHVLMGPLKIRG